METILAKLEQAGLCIARDEPMERHTSFRIGGPIRAMIFPEEEEQLILAVQLLHDAGICPLLVGNGSNLLVSDRPIDRIAIKTHDGVSKLEAVGDTGIYVSSGTLLSKVAVFAREHFLTGLEFAHGIPGTLGGAVSMNAGAYGGEMAQVVRKVYYLDEDNIRRTASGEQLGFAYRHSMFSDTETVILGAFLQLATGETDAIRERMEELSAKRRASQPLNFPSAGSTFKRPMEGYAAALIDEAGLKGYTVGGAQVSEKHAGFVINRGGASFDDVCRVIEHVQETVYRRAGISLELEVKLIK